MVMKNDTKIIIKKKSGYEVEYQVDLRTDMHEAILLAQEIYRHMKVAEVTVLSEEYVIDGDCVSKEFHVVAKFGKFRGRKREQADGDATGRTAKADLREVARVRSATKRGSSPLAPAVEGCGRATKNN